MGLAPFPKKGQHSFIMTSCLFPGRQCGLSKCHSGELQHPQTAAALQMVGGNAVLGTWGGAWSCPSGSTKCRTRTLQGAPRGSWVKPPYSVMVTPGTRGMTNLHAYKDTAFISPNSKSLGELHVRLSAWVACCKYTVYYISPAKNS